MIGCRRLPQAGKRHRVNRPRQLLRDLLARATARAQARHCRSSATVKVRAITGTLFSNFGEEALLDHLDARVARTADPARHGALNRYLSQGTAAAA